MEDANEVGAIICFVAMVICVFGGIISFIIGLESSAGYFGVCVFGFLFAGIICLGLGLPPPPKDSQEWSS